MVTVMQRFGRGPMDSWAFLVATRSDVDDPSHT